MNAEVLFFTLLFVISFLYSSVGHGGASGYLALMALYNFTSATMRPTALLLNVLVSGIAFVQFYRNGFFKWDLFWPFAVTSIPAAFIGGLIDLDEVTYGKVLGILLLLSVFRLLITDHKQDKVKSHINIAGALIAGAVIGLISGTIGIGGGIILSPLILFLYWANLKETATVSALFIFVNSIAGLAGVFLKGIQFDSLMAGMLAVSIAGGMLGAYFGASRFNSSVLKYTLSFVLIIASMKLLFT
jgi:uncharacterized membrane protein YfcA